MVHDSGFWRVSLDSSNKVRGAASIKTYAQTLYGAGCLFTLNTGKTVNTEIYPSLNCGSQR
jgi:hypothetical protein